MAFQHIRQDESVWLTRTRTAKTRTQRSPSIWLGGLLLAMAMTLAACGDDASGDTEPDETTPVSTPEETPAAAPEADTDSPVADTSGDDTPAGDAPVAEDTPAPAEESPDADADPVAPEEAAADEAPADEALAEDADAPPPAEAADTPPAEDVAAVDSPAVETEPTIDLADGALELDADMAARIAAADADNGQSYVQRCTGCHSFRPEGPGVRGPFVGAPLFGVFGRRVGGFEGLDEFEYSPAFAALEEAEIEWNEARLNAFLADPEGTVPGTAMNIRGVTDPQDRADVIAFLVTLVPEGSPDGVAGDPALLERIAEADIEDGELLAARCATCHQFTADAETLTGPNLFGIVGAAVGGAEGFTYSPAMAALHEDEAVWDYDRLDEFIANPAVAIPGTRMGFGGIDDPDNRAAIIAFLRSISPNAPEAAGAGLLGIGTPQEGLNPLAFTATQVSFGMQYYSLNGCDACHGTNLQGLANNSVDRLAPALTGTAFAERWFGGTVYELFDYVYQHAGAVSEIQDGLIPLFLAYILSENGFQTGGNAELPRDRETLQAMGFFQ